MKTFLSRRERIVLTAFEVLHELGLQGFSTREIARREGISEAAIFKHYSTKNDMLLAMLEHYSKYDDDISNSIQLFQLGPVDAIVYFFRTYAEHYQGDPALTAVMLIYDFLQKEPSATEKVLGIFHERNKRLASYIQAAQQEGLLRDDISAEQLAEIFSGMLREVCLRWRLTEYAFPLKGRVMSSLHVLLDALRERGVTKQHD